MTCSIENRLMRRQNAGNLRTLSQASGLIDFASNDYLGLARSETLKNEFLNEWEKIGGVGSTGSRLLTGNSKYAEELENSIASFHGYKSGLLFGSGYMANAGLFRAVAASGDTILYDACIHASMLDGIKLSHAKALPFRHNDINHLENRLKSCSINGNRYIALESLYSTDGSEAPISAISRLAKNYDARLIVDEAHAVGACGPKGRGLAQENVFALVATFGKALGVYGAIILGNSLLKEALINFASSAIYTTAMPFYSLAAIKSSYALFPQMEVERKHLKKLIQKFQNVIHGYSRAHIQPVKFAGNKAVKEASLALLKEGVDARALMSPTVRRGQEALRIALHAYNTEEELDFLLEKIEVLRG